MLAGGITVDMIHVIGGYVVLLTLILCGYKLARKWQEIGL